MGCSENRCRWLSGVAGVLLSGLVISVVVVKAQESEFQVRGVRLQPNSTDNDNTIDGTVQVLVDSREWMPLSSNSKAGHLSASIGEVLCRQVGYGKYRGSKTVAMQNRETVYEANLICNGSESSLNECIKRHPLIVHNIMHHIGITCAASNCVKENGRCSQICHNNPVDPTKGCGCFKGYTLSGTNLTECVDVDECLVNNGGCERGCVNTLGSYRCTCPTYAFWDEKTRSCTEFGATVVCDGDKMTAAFSKEAYPMLQTDAISLLDHSCRARENATHYILETRYDECMTTKEATSEGFKYSNVITSTAKESFDRHIGFSSLIHISFSCLINKTASSNINVTPEPMLLKSVAETVFEPAIRLSLCNDVTCLTTQGMTRFKQADIIYARLSLISQDYDLKFNVRDCKVITNDGTNVTSIFLIANGTSNMEWVKIIEPSGQPDFVFRFPAFTLGKFYKSLKLQCTASLTTLSSRQRSNAYTQTDASTIELLATNQQIGDDHPLIYSCYEAKYDGVYRLVTSNFVVKVWCDVTSADGPWLTFMRRTNGALNFTRTWKNYEDGFGTADGEFWLGNKFLHLVTKDQAAALRITLTTYSNVTSYSDYGFFRVADSLGDYRLTIDQHSGPAGDMRNASGCTSNPASFQLSTSFSTHDRDNDNFDNYTCAKRGGGWWYFDCNCTCLTCGPSINGAAFTRKGMLFYSFNDLYVLKASEMKLRFPRLSKDTAKQENVKSVNGSAVTCNLEEMTVALERSIFDQPAEHNLTVNSDSFISQSRNTTHFVLSFKLRGMDTTRQVNSEFIDYKKKVSIGPQFSRYYSQLDMTMLCSARKAVIAEQSYSVEKSDVEIQLEETGFHRAKLVLYTDNALKSPLGVSERLSEGAAVFVQAVPDHSLPGSRLSISSCSVRGLSNSDSAIRIIQNRCPTAKDVHMMAPDSFSMRAFSLKESTSINIQCVVETCSADNAECLAACDESLRKRRSPRSVFAIALAVSQPLFVL